MASVILDVLAAMPTRGNGNSNFVLIKCLRGTLGKVKQRIVRGIKLLLREGMFLSWK